MKIFFTISLIFLSGCTWNKVTSVDYPSFKENKNNSFAFNVLNAARLTTEEGPITDVIVDTNNSSTDSVELLSSGYLAIQGFSGALAKPDFMNNGVSGGIFAADLLFSLLSSGAKPEAAYSRWIIWYPADGLSSEEARDNIDKLLFNAYLKALPEGYQIVAKDVKWEAKLASGVNNVKFLVGGDCYNPYESSSNLCAVGGSSELPVKSKAPSWLSFQSSFEMGTITAGYSWNKVQTMNLPSKFSNLDKAISGIDDNDFFLRMTSFLPEYFYYYRAPIENSENDYPIVMSQGKGYIFAKKSQ